MSAVVRTDEWPRRAETVARSTPSASRRLAWLCRRTWSDAPLGRPSRRQSRDNLLIGPPGGGKTALRSMRIDLTPALKDGAAATCLAIRQARDSSCHSVHLGQLTGCPYLSLSIPLGWHPSPHTNRCTTWPASSSLRCLTR